MQGHERDVKGFVAVAVIQNADDSLSRRWCLKTSAWNLICTWESRLLIAVTYPRVLPVLDPSVWSAI